MSDADQPTSDSAQDAETAERGATQDVEASQPKGPPTWWRWTRRGIELVAVIVLCMWAWGVAQDLMESEPKAKRQRGGERAPTLVDVVEAEAFEGPVVVSVAGTVMPAREVDVAAQIAGVVASLEQPLDPGDVVAGGSELLRLDRRDYRLAVKRARAALEEARAGAALEAGNQRIAKAELELLRDNVEVDESLILRKPQLAVVEASVKSARAALEDAQLALSRTTVVAPWDAQVVARHVDVGSPVGSNTPLTRLIGIETWWVEAQVPLEQLKWLDMPPREAGGDGSPGNVRLAAAWEAGQTRRGHVRQSRPGVEAQGRMARLLVAVDDPLALLPENEGEPSMVLGAWATVDLEGRRLDGSVSLAREFVRDNDQVWVMNGEDELEIRDLEIAYRGPDHVLATAGVEPGDRIVKTPLPVAVPGMKLRVEDSPAESGDGTGETPDESGAPGAGGARGGDGGARGEAGAPDGEQKAPRAEEPARDTKRPTRGRGGRSVR